MSSKLDQKRWGPWTYNANADTLVVEMTPGGQTYEVDVASMDRDFEELADWINQLMDKSWVDPTKIGHFICALNEIFEIRSLTRK